MMRNKSLRHTLIGLLAGATASISFAQDAQEKASTDRITRLLDADKISGSAVWDYKGNQIGSIERVLLQPFGEMAFVVVDAEDMLGEERLIAVPWKVIYVKHKEGDRDELVFSLDATEAKLRAAPVYNADSGLDLHDTDKVQPIFQHWGITVPAERTTPERTTPERTTPERTTPERTTPERTAR